MNDVVDIKAPTIASAIEIAHMETDSFRFRNSSLVDIDYRIKHFIFNEQDFIAKRTQPIKAIREVKNAELAQKLITGTQIGEHVLSSVVPRIIYINSSPESCYLVSEYLGPDINENYYLNNVNTLNVNELGLLLDIFTENGIEAGSLLPRNIIPTPGKINIIDWENVNFGNHHKIDRISWTKLFISWSYFFEKDKIDEIGKRKGINYSDDVTISDYEKKFSEITSIESDTEGFYKLVCSTAIRAEADRGYNKLSYKLDDIFHVVGELLPLNIEVLLDIMFAHQNNDDHKNVSESLSLAFSDLISLELSRLTPIEISKFKQSCSALIMLLSSDEYLNSDVTNLKSIDLQNMLVSPVETGKLLQKALTDLNPSINPGIGAILETANNIHQIADEVFYVCD